jgi:hypothetical protein
LLTVCTENSDIIYALQETALANGLSELPAFADPSVLPPQPDVVLPSAKRSRTAAAVGTLTPATATSTSPSPSADADNNNSSGAMAGGEAEAEGMNKARKGLYTDTPAAGRSDAANLSVTLQSLRENAIARGKRLKEQEEALQAQKKITEEAHARHRLPFIADTLRSLFVRKNRSRMLLKECTGSICSTLYLKSKVVTEAMKLIEQVVPEFFTVLPAAHGVPSTVQINLSTPYKEVRQKLVTNE